MNTSDLLNKTVFLSDGFRFIYWSEDKEFSCIDLKKGKRVELAPQVYEILSIAVGKTVSEASTHFTETSINPFLGIITRLFDNQILVENPTDVIIEEYKSRPIEVLVVEITGKCNASCVFCYGKDSRKRECFSIERLDEILKSYRSIGGVSVAISGGEPTVSANLILFIKLIEDNGLLLTGMGTNGSIFTEELIDCLSKTVIVDGISFSLDSMWTVEHSKIRGINNLGNDVIDAIGKLNDRSIPVIINTIINRKMGPVVEFGSMLSELGVNKWRLIQPFGVDRATDPDFYYSFDEELDILADAYHAHQNLAWSFSLMSDTFINCLHNSVIIPDHFQDNRLCGHRSRSLYVKANGDVLRCNISREKAVANVYCKSIKEIWEDEYTHAIKRPRLNGYETCSSCKAKKVGLCSVNTFCPEIDINEGKCNQRLERIYNRYTLHHSN